MGSAWGSNVCSRISPSASQTDISCRGFEHEMAEREGFEPSIRVTPDTAFPVRVTVVHPRPRGSILHSLTVRLARSCPPESGLVQPRGGHGGGQKTPELAASPAPQPSTGSPAPRCAGVRISEMAPTLPLRRFAQSGRTRGCVASRALRETRWALGVSSRLEPLRPSRIQRLGTTLPRLGPPVRSRPPAVTLSGRPPRLSSRESLTPSVREATLRWRQLTAMDFTAE
jgi:hypothetical protein